MHGSVTLPAAKFNSCWGTSRSRRRSVTLDVNSDYDARSTTVSESSRTPLELRARGRVQKRPPFATREDLLAGLRYFARIDSQFTLLVSAAVGSSVG